MSKEIRYCEICGVDSNTKCVLNRKLTNSCLCDKHYGQFIKFGEFMDNNQRCVHDPNEIRILENHAEIDTYDEYGNIVCTFKLDLDDVDKLYGHKWRCVKKRNRNYLFTGNQFKEKIYFHRLVLPTELQVDHISGDSTDNRKSNLRIVLGKDNQKNMMKSIRNTSGIRGVTFGKEDNTWRVDFSVDTIRIYLKHFVRKEEAVYARYILEVLCLGKMRNKSNDEEYFKYINMLTNKERIKLVKYVKEKINIAKARV